MRNAILIGLLVVFGILLGIASAWAWFFGLIPFVRAMIPYALLFAGTILISTAFLRARCGAAPADLSGVRPTCKSVRSYSLLILIVAAIFIVFSMVVLATYLPFILRFILAFVGSISFWIMLFAFLSMIGSIFIRR